MCSPSPIPLLFLSSFPHLPSPSSHQHVISKLAKANPDLALDELRQHLLSLVDPSFGDMEAAEFIEQNSSVINERVASVRSGYVSQRIVDYSTQDRQGALEGLMLVLSTLSPEDKAALVSRLQ